MRVLRFPHPIGGRGRNFSPPNPILLRPRLVRRPRFGTMSDFWSSAFRWPARYEQKKQDTNRRKQRKRRAVYLSLFSPLPPVECIDVFAHRNERAGDTGHAISRRR